MGLGQVSSFRWHEEHRCGWAERYEHELGERQRLADAIALLNKTLDEANEKVAKYEAIYGPLPSAYVVEAKE